LIELLLLAGQPGQIAESVSDDLISILRGVLVTHGRDR
jgi:hypothetical protein